MNGSFWKSAATATIGTFCSTVLNAWNHIGAHVEIDASGGQQQAIVALRAALQDRDLEAVFGIGAIGQRLIEAAMLRLGAPIGRETHAIERGGGKHSARHDEGGRNKKERQSQQEREPSRIGICHLRVRPSRLLSSIPAFRVRPGAMQGLLRSRRIFLASAAPTEAGKRGALEHPAFEWNHLKADKMP